MRPAATTSRTRCHAVLPCVVGEPGALATKVKVPLFLFPRVLEALLFPGSAALLMSPAVEGSQDGESCPPPERHVLKTGGSISVQAAALSSSKTSCMCSPFIGLREPGDAAWLVLLHFLQQLPPRVPLVAVNRFRFPLQFASRGPPGVGQLWQNFAETSRGRGHADGRSSTILLLGFSVSAQRSSYHVCGTVPCSVDAA